MREIRQRLADQARDLHTSVITTLNIMVRKKFLKRALEGNAFLFEPCVSREQTLRDMLGDVVNRVFDGSAISVMLTLLDGKKVDGPELKELRRYINRKARENLQ